MAMPWDGYASRSELLALCERLGLEINGDILQSGDGVMNVQEFVSSVVNHCKPPTPSASTPYRQLKRHHSTQPFDEGGRRIATASAMSSTIGTRLFSTLDDGTGNTPVESILDAWMEEGIENSTEILQALDFSLDGKLNLGDLTVALENELLVTKNGIHQAALASFKSEIRYLLERVDRELREKEKIRSDLEKAEKLKSQLAAEVDEHHSAIERTNLLNLRKLEQDHKEKLAAVRTELIQEMDQIQQQAGLQREELEAEMEKIREDESFLRDHLSISVKENRRLEMELLDSNEKVVEAQSQIAKLQMGLDNVLKEKFGDLDPGTADFFIQEERIKQLRNSYEAQCRELQDRIDELQSELQEFHLLGRAHQPCNKPLSEEMESKSPGMESDPGLGSEEGQPFNMSLEAEMMLEQLKERHLREMEDLQTQLESKISEFDKMVEEQRAVHEEQKAAISLQYQAEVQALREEMVGIQGHAQELQNHLQQVELERTALEQRQAAEKEELQKQQEEEAGTLRQQLLEAHTHNADLEDQLKTLEAQRAETEVNLDAELQELKELHAMETKKLEEHKELLEARLEEERGSLQVEMGELEKRLLEGWEREKEQLQQSREDELRARLEEVRVRFEEERDELVKTLTEEWQKEKAQLEEQCNESLQVVLEEEMLRLVREQEEKESEFMQRWETERARLQERHEDALLARVAEERSQLRAQQEQKEKRLREEWEREKLQLEEDYEGMLADRLSEERERFEAEKEEAEKRLERLTEEERVRLEESHREAMQELTGKHSEERERLGSMLDKLRDDIAQERRELEIQITQRIKEVEDRFSGDQESVAMRFQADVFKLEQHYQNELKALSESHAEQKRKWEAETEEAKEQRRRMQEQEQDGLNREWAKEKLELESSHREEMEALVTKNQELQKELDDFASSAQTKEIELSRQLNDLHNRLQESLESKDELLTMSEKKALEIELLLNEAVDDFKQERAEFQDSLSELTAKYNEVLSMSERQTEERIGLVTECDDLKMKNEELEMLLKQAAVDFELDRRELQENISTLEEKLKHNLSCCESQEDERVELIAERDLLSIRIKEVEMELNRLLASEEMEESNEVEEKVGEDPEMYSNSNEICGETCGDDKAIVIPEDYNDDFEFVVPLDQVLEVEIITKPFNEREICPNNDIDIESNRESAPNLSFPVEASSLVSQNDDIVMVAETPDAMEGCSGSTGDVKDYKTVKNPTCLENINVSGQGCDDQVVPKDCQVGESSSAKDQTRAEDKTEEDSCPPELAPSDDYVPEFLAPDGNRYGNALYERSVVENTSSPEALEHEDPGEDATECENSVALESCEEEKKPQDVLVLENESHSHEEEQCHEIVVAPGETDELTREVNCLPNDSLGHGQEVFLLECQQTSTETNDDPSDYVHDSLEPQDQNSHCEDQDCSLLKLQALYSNAADENILLQEKISLLQQKTDTLEIFLAHNNEKIETGHRALVENYNLKVKMLFLLEQVKELEMKTLEMTGLQFRYEDCIFENAKLKDQNSELEKRVWGLESRMHLVHDFQDQQIALVDEISRTREENTKLSELVGELERRDEIVLAVYPDARPSETTTEESFQDLNIQLESGIQEVSDLEDSCVEFEKQNTKLHRAVKELQDKSLTLNESIQAHRSEASRLAEENLILSRRIAALKEEDLKEAQEDLLQKLEHFRKEKIAAQKMAENFKKQISELRLRSHQAEHENRLLSETNTQSAANLEALSQQLEELMKENERREAVPAAKTTQMEAELTKTLEGTAQLEERNAQLTQQLSGLREKVAKVDTMEIQLSHLLQERKSVDKEVQGLRSQLAKAQDRVKTVDESLQAANLQSGRLKSEVRVSQKERDTLKHEVIALHKQLQNAKDESRSLERVFHSSSFQSQNKKLHRDETSRLLKQEQQVLRQENERLQVEVRNTKEDLLLSREKVRQLEAAILSLKQHRHQNPPGLVKALEQENASLKQENASLKQELEATKELTRGRETGEGHTELENLRQENETLKAQMARLSTQLLETLQAQFVGLLPPSPHRLPRGQHRGDDPDHLQGPMAEQRAAHADSYRRIGGL